MSDTLITPGSNNDLAKTVPKDSPLRRLIKIFRTNTVVKHHFQSPRSEKPVGVAKAFFKSGYQFQSSVIPGYGEYDRFARYSDYAEMESYPILNKALDIVADEVTQRDEEGQMLKVRSSDKEIQKIGQELFDDILNLNGKELPKIVRQVCKYGDAMFLIDATEDHGVVNLINMPANEVEREEGFDKDEPTAVRFRWSSRGNIEIPNAYVAHFRLDGNDLFKPYGQCVRFDSKILTNDGIKEIRNIRKGDQVLSFNIEQQKQEFSRVLDTVCSGEKQCFKVKTRHNCLEQTSEHQTLVYRDDEFRYLPTESLRIGDRLVLSKEHKVESRVAIDKSKPGENKNGWWNSIDCVPDHVDTKFARFFGFMLGDGWIDSNNMVSLAWGENDEVNDFYQELLEEFSGKSGRYSLRRTGDDITNPGSISNVKVGSKMLSTVLKRMGFVGNVYSKRIPDWAFSTSREVREAILQGMQDADGSEFTDKWCTRYQLELSNEALIKDFKCLVQSLGYKSSNISSRHRGIGDLIEGVEVKSRRDSHYFYYYKTSNKQFKSQDITNRKTDEFILEPIVSIEKSDIAETYDIHVDHRDHNFYANGAVVHNSFLESARRPWRQLVLMEDAMMVYRITRAPERRVYYLDIMGIPPENVEEVVKKFNETIKKEKVVNDQGKIDLRYGSTMSMEEDFVIPTRGKDSATRIDTLPGGQNASDIEDIEFIKKNLFASLGIPKAFLTFDEDVGAKSILTHEDIRFARSIARIQGSIINELVKILMIHLYIKGYRGKSLVDFEIKMTNPSTVAELQKNELWRARMELVQTAGDGVFDTNFIYKNFLHLTDESIDMIRKGQIMDKLFQSKLLQIEGGGQMGMDGMGMGGMGMGMGMDMGMGGMGGMGGGMGGAAPNISGLPMESLNPAAQSFGAPESGANHRKDLTRRNSDERIAEKRGVAELPSDMVDDQKDVQVSADTAMDMSGIEREYTSPMGTNESNSVTISLKTILEGYRGLTREVREDVADRLLYKAYPFLRATRGSAATCESINESILAEQFGDVGEDQELLSEISTRRILQMERQRVLTESREKIKQSDTGTAEQLLEKALEDTDAKLTEILKRFS